MMMDLAEIRKKAKARTKSGGQTPVAEAKPATRATFSIQGAPAEPVVVSPPVLTTPAPSPPLYQDDPLEALFNSCPDVVLATEESYLQTLRAEDEQKSETVYEWLSFPLGREEYALDIEGVSEIIKPREITDIPRVPEFILGVISLRGIIVPVFDLRKRLKLGAGELTAASRIIVCQQGDRAAGLLVDSITQVVRMPVSSVEPPPAVFSGVDRELLAGVGRMQGRMLILLNLANVLNAELN
jgi:purine-binding chemotaxis protein CheW